MKKIGVLLVMLVFALILCGGAFGETSKTILNKWVPYDHSFTYNQIVYTIQTLNTELEDPTNGVVRLRRSDNLNVLIPYGECVETLNYSYCFENVSFDNEYIDIDEDGKLQPALKLKFIEYSYKEAMKVSKIVSKTNLNLYDEVEVKIILENSGDYDLSNVRIEEEIPLGYEVISKPLGWTQVGTKISFITTLFKNAEKEYIYVINPIEYKSGDLITKIKYDTETELNKEIKEVKKTLKIIEPYTLKFGLTANKIIKINDKINYYFELTNNENEDLIIEELIFEISPNLKVGTIIDFNQPKHNYYVVNDLTLTPGQTKKFNLNIEVPYTGKFYLEQNGKFNVKAIEYTHKDRQLINVTTENLNCEIRVDNEEGNVDDIINYNLVLQNNGLNEIYNINVNSIVDGKSENYNLEKLQGKSGEVILNQNSIKLPDKNSVDIELKGQYKTVNGQLLSCYSKKTILINNFDDEDTNDLFEDGDGEVEVVTKKDSTKTDTSGMNFFEKLFYLVKSIFS
ncbi:MAG: hypothetical protein AB7V77_04110 [Candidatus Woesearchaeota archaeon]